MPKKGRGTGNRDEGRDTLVLLQAPCSMPLAPCSKPCALWYGIMTTLALLALVAALALEW